MFLIPKSKCLPLKQNTQYRRKLSTPAALNHHPEKWNFYSLIIVSSKFMLNLYLKSVFTIISATCGQFGSCEFLQRITLSFQTQILFEFRKHFLSVRIFWLCWNTWLALTHFRLSILVIHKCTLINWILTIRKQWKILSFRSLTFKGMHI